MSEHRRVNDIGGQPAGPVETSHHVEEQWHKLITALGNLLGRERKMINLHERRRTVEDLDDDYWRLAYFERAAQATANLLVEKGVATHEEIAARIAEMRSRSDGK